MNPNRLVLLKNFTVPVTILIPQFGNLILIEYLNLLAAKGQQNGKVWLLFDSIEPQTIQTSCDGYLRQTQAKDPGRQLDLG